MFEDRNLRFDLFALGLLGSTIFMALSLVSYSPADPLAGAIFPLNLVYTPNQIAYPLNTHIQNVCGHAGATCADILFGIFGISAYFVVGCIAAVDVWFLLRKEIDGAAIRLTGLLMALVGGVTFIQMFAPPISFGPIIGPGGYLGAMGRTFLETHFATVGSFILLVCLIGSGVMLCTDYVLFHFAAIAGTALINMMPRSELNILGRIGALWNRQRFVEDDGEYYEDDEYEYDEEEDDVEFDELEPSFAKRAAGRMVSDLSEPMEGDEEFEEEVDSTTEDELDDSEYEFVEEYEDEDTDTPKKQLELFKPLKGKAKKEADRQEVIAQLEEASRESDPQDYELPTHNLLNPAEGYNVEELTKEVKRKAQLLEKTFEDFNLDVKVVDIETGPVIAQYEVALKRGLRLSKITGLADDLAIALRVPSVRIVAPIPGKNTVGIEVPNDERQIVRLREVMNETNSRVRKMAIPIYLGKDVSGNPLAVDLAALPHLLIAGRTGTGKSVCLNAIITSMLMSKTPDDVRMLMIDPKMVELSGYARLPHLMHPVVTDMRKAEAILAWACEKMDERYQLLARAGVRHISSYNQLGEEELMERLQPETEDEKKLIPRHLPYIVIVADEMADLMMTAGKEVEAHIIRLAAKSRAIGIHLILATQKPTVDVITGLIKSNLPARIAFQVASKTDSRVVLDENGADKLLGYGDMLFLSPGTSTLLRGQGTYLSDDEIDRVVDYCGSRGEQNFVRELVQLKIEDKEDGEAVQLKQRDELYEDAVEVVVREGRGSVSLLQRNLQIGYGRAARLIDFMAEDGIVGAYNGSQAREVLMTMADWEATKANTADAAPATPPEPNTEILKPQLAKIAIPPADMDDDYAAESQYEDDDLDDAEADEETDEEEVLAAEDEEYEVEDDEELVAEDEEYEEDEELAAEDEEYEDEDDEELVDEEEYEDDEWEDDEAEPDEERHEVSVIVASGDQKEAELASQELENDQLKYEAEDAEFEGEEFDQEDFDEESFQAAVASQTGLDAEDYEDVDEVDNDEKEASEIATLKARHKRRRRVPTTDDKTIARRKGSSRATVRIHRSHSE